MEPAQDKELWVAPKVKLFGYVLKDNTYSQALSNAENVMKVANAAKTIKTVCNAKTKKKTSKVL